MRPSARQIRRQLCRGPELSTGAKPNSPGTEPATIRSKTFSRLSKVRTRERRSPITRLRESTRRAVTGDSPGPKLMPPTLASNTMSQRRASDRKRVPRETLERAVTAAVKKSDPQCEAFVGVLIEHHAPRARIRTGLFTEFGLEQPLAASAAKPWSPSSIKSQGFEFQKDHAAGYADLETRSGAVMQERPIRTACAYDQANARPRSRLTFGCILMGSADVALHPPQRG
jgi:hypothetical protein